jgi:hypothetical protein
MNKQRWFGISAISSGLLFLVPLIFYFFVLPAAGSSATHAKDPVSFLPWMADRGELRVALWWFVSISFGVMMLGAPTGLRSRIEGSSPVAARVSELAGILGAFSLVVSGLMLAGGEMPVAIAYINAAGDSRDAIVALYEWQRLATALLFDVLGFGLLGIWIGVGCIAGLRTRVVRTPLGILGLLTALLLVCFAFGYALQIPWLGESGIGAASFLALPAWLIWFGVICC